MLNSFAQNVDKLLSKMHAAALIDCLWVNLVHSCIHELVSIETFLTGDVFSQLCLPIAGGREMMRFSRRLQGARQQTDKFCICIAF